MGKIINLSKNKTLISRFIYEKDDKNDYVYDEDGNRRLAYIETK